MDNLVKFKTCNKCRFEKPFSEFSKGNDKHGLQYICKNCVSKYHAKYYKDNKKVFAEKHARYNKNNKEKNTKRRKIYRSNNKKKIFISNTKYQQSKAPYNLFSFRLSWAEDVCGGPNGELVVKCRYCGKPYIPTIEEANSRIKALVGKLPGECCFYCSLACK